MADTGLRRIEWGKLNNGQRYSIRALDIDRALAAARLGLYETIYLQQAIEDGWHGAVKASKRSGQAWPDPKPARVNIYKLARKTGLLPRNFHKAKRTLLDSRILSSGPNGKVWINKQADDWIDPTTGKRRLTTDLLIWCDEARPKIQKCFPHEEEDKRTLSRETGEPCPKRQGNPVPEDRGTLFEKTGSHREERGRGDLKKTSNTLFETEGTKKGSDLRKQEIEKLDRELVEANQRDEQ